MPKIRMKARMTVEFEYELDLVTHYHGMTMKEAAEHDQAHFEDYPEDLMSAAGDAGVDPVVTVEVLSCE